MSHPPRYSSTPLPPYSYVPGHAPHPVSDSRGHMHGHVPTTPSALNPEDWQSSDAYRYGVDLFNCGYYWEAHEAWESLWHAAGRRGPTAVWLKALIKLAAAAVKLREGNARGAVRHAQRSRALVDELRATLPAGKQHYCGLALQQVEQAARGVEDSAAAKGLIADPRRLIDAQLRLFSL